MATSAVRHPFAPRSRRSAVYVVSSVPSNIVQAGACLPTQSRSPMRSRRRSGSPASRSGYDHHSLMACPANRSLAKLDRSEDVSYIDDQRIRHHGTEVAPVPFSELWPDGSAYCASASESASVGSPQRAALGLRTDLAAEFAMGSKPRTSTPSFNRRPTIPSSGESRKSSVSGF